MTKRKIIYISIAIGCTMTLILSVVGFLPGIFFIESTDLHRQERAVEQPLETGLSEKPAEKSGEPTDVVDEPEPQDKDKIEGVEISQAIEGLYLPTYDKDGNEQLVLRGEHTVFVNNRLYRITNPIIDIYYVSEERPSEEPTYVTITSLRGEMDKLTNIGILNDDVVIKITEKMNAYTDTLTYEPEKGRIRTDDNVTIIGERMKVTGKGFVTDLAEQSAQIKTDVELDIEASPAGMPQRHTHISSSGPFVFEKRTNTATFQGSAQVTCGTLTLIADTLELHLNPNNGKLTQLVAKGNVQATEAPTLAKAKTLTWDTSSQIVTLEGGGAPVAGSPGSAELFEGNTSITSPKILLNQKDGIIEVPSGGRLVTKLEAHDEPTPPSITNITWKGSMSFSKDKNEALFKKSVTVTKEDSKINCGFLLVNFDPESSVIKTLKASKTVHIVESKGQLKREAKAAQVIWETKGNLVEMVAEPFAWIQEGNRRVTAPYIMSFNNGQKTICEGQGTLSISPENEEVGSASNTGTVEVSWLDRMSIDNTQQRALFYGGVKTLNGEQKIESDKLDVRLDGNNNFDKITANGNVYFKDLRKGGIEGIGDIASWDCSLGFVVLGGNPKAELRREKSRSFSRLISYDLQSQHINWENGTHLQLPFSR